MAKSPPTSSTPPEAVISIIGAGMTLDGDSETDGSVRIEGTIRGNVRAGKSVVIGRDGFVDGSIFTQDAVVAGRVSGGIHALSRLELLATSQVSGEIEAPRMQVEEGAKVQGQVAIGSGGGKAEPVPRPGDPEPDAPEVEELAAELADELADELDLDELEPEELELEEDEVASREGSRD